MGLGCWIFLTTESTEGTELACWSGTWLMKLFEHGVWSGARWIFNHESSLIFTNVDDEAFGCWIFDHGKHGEGAEPGCWSGIWLMGLCRHFQGFLLFYIPT